MWMERLEVGGVVDAEGRGGDTRDTQLVANKHSPAPSS